MSVNYYVDTVTGYINFDFTNQEINVSSDYDKIEIQELNDVIREAEAAFIGLSFAKICDTSGKEVLDVDTGVSVGITLELLDDWKVYSEKSSGIFKVYGGNLLRSDGGDPFKPNTLITYVVINSAASTIVSVSTGSGLSTEEHNRLFTLPTETLTEEQDTRLETIETEQQNQLTEDRFKDLTFNRTNTIEGLGENKKITSYVAGDSEYNPVEISVSYDELTSEGLPVSEEIQT